MLTFTASHRFRSLVFHPPRKAWTMLASKLVPAVKWGQGSRVTAGQDGGGNGTLATFGAKHCRHEQRGHKQRKPGEQDSGDTQQHDEDCEQTRGKSQWSEAQSGAQHSRRADLPVRPGTGARGFVPARSRVLGVCWTRGWHWKRPTAGAAAGGASGHPKRPSR